MKEETEVETGENSRSTYVNKPGTILKLRKCMNIAEITLRKVYSSIKIIVHGNRIKIRVQEDRIKIWKTPVYMEKIE